MCVFASSFPKTLDRKASVRNNMLQNNYAKRENGKVSLCQMK